MLRLTAFEIKTIIIKVKVNLFENMAKKSKIK